MLLRSEYISIRFIYINIAPCVKRVKHRFSVIFGATSIALLEFPIDFASIELLFCSVQDSRNAQNKIDTIMLHRIGDVLTFWRTDLT